MIQPGGKSKIIELLSHCENAEWSWYQIADGREATWSCCLRLTLALPSLA